MIALRVLLVLLPTLLWIGYGLFMASVFVNDFHQYWGRTLAATLLTALAIGLGKLGTVLLFRTPQAAWGMLIGIGASLPVVVSSGFFMFGLGVMSSDSGMEAAAEASYFVVPLIVGVPAFCALLGGFIGALVGQLIARSRRRVLAATAEQAVQQQA